MSSLMLRVGITADEFAQLQALSRQTGVPVTRLAADAIRQLLKERTNR